MTERPSRLQRLAFILDELFRVPGTNFRFGIDPLLGLIPGGGDVAGSILSAYTLVVATRMGAPAPVVVRMGFNILVDAVVGAVPLLGDLFDAGFKANRRNVDLLQRYLDEPRPVTRSSRALLLAVLLVLLLVVVAAALTAMRVTVWLVSQL
ncbi:MAG TPA: DUF4112 domain-containing protein [Longimicrobiales bacterium]|nr:DUF4112 domain-containing protein [Longimicrobiales bacterium]